jgi:hypothetical protein
MSRPFADGMKSSDFALNILKGEIASFLDHLPIV